MTPTHTPRPSPRTRPGQGGHAYIGPVVYQPKRCFVGRPYTLPGAVSNAFNAPRYRTHLSAQQALEDAATAPRYRYWLMRTGPDQLYSAHESVSDAATRLGELRYPDGWSVQDRRAPPSS